MCVAGLFHRILLQQKKLNSGLNICISYTSIKHKPRPACTTSCIATCGYAKNYLQSWKKSVCKTSWCKPSSYLMYVCKGELDRMNGQGLFLPSPLGWLHFLCALAARCALWRSFCSWLHFAEPHSAARTIHSAKKHTQQVFVADGDSFSATFFSPSFQRAFICVKTLPLGEVFS